MRCLLPAQVAAHDPPDADDVVEPAFEDVQWRLLTVSSADMCVGSRHDAGAAASMLHWEEPWGACDRVLSRTFKSNVICCDC